MNKGNARHGKHGTPLYKKWKSMRGRVGSHPHYIEHNIKCCDEWSNFLSFEEWSINNGYKELLSLDRIDTHKNYEPSNCRWVDKSTQAANIRIKKNNKTGYSGVSYNQQKEMYIAQIQYKEKRFYLGQYAEPIDAALAFDEYVISNKLPHTLNFGGHHEKL